jgi:hypothetical protein
MRKWTIIALGALLGLGLAACGARDSLKPAMDAMKSGDLGRAESLLDAEALKTPDSKPLRALRLVLYRHLSVHGASEKQADYLKKAIAEYDVLAQALGLKPDYSDMEGSLRASPEGATLLSNARKPLYGE